MLELLRSHPKRTIRLVERVLEGMREIAILLIVFAPLDAALLPSDIRSAAAWLLLLGCGVLLFIAALLIEWRYAG
jgi:hypothetical protein